MVDDNIVIDYFVSKERNALISSRTNVKNLEKDAEMAEYLRNRYSEPFLSYVEVIARIYHSIDEKPRCRVCGGYKPYLGFKKPYSDSPWCSSHCQMTDRDFISERTSKIDYSLVADKTKDTLLKRYGDSNYRNLEKAKATMIERYGSPTALSRHY